MPQPITDTFDELREQHDFVRLAMRAICSGELNLICVEINGGHVMRT